MTIAIDGHSSCGKSTFARAIAADMNYIYIDSGAMYRAVTLAFMDRGILRDGGVDREAIAEVLGSTDISFRREEPGTAQTATFLNGVNVEERIRGIEVASNVSTVSSLKEVREKLVSIQRQMGREKGIVMDGRDIGTVVFPDADIKIFLTASAAIRAERRYKELIEKGEQVSFGEILANITERDRIDESRSESPLRKADDAILLDNSNMTPREQMVWFRRVIAERYGE